MTTSSEATWSGTPPPCAARTMKFTWSLLASLGLLFQIAIATPEHLLMGVPLLGGSHRPAEMR